jgi:hypothetical protein
VRVAVRRRERRRRPLPWEALLAVAAVTAAAGLVTTVDQGTQRGALALLVPLLLIAAVGAVGGRVAVVALGRVVSARPARPPSAGVRPAAAVRRTARWLAVRRLAAPSRERSAVVAVLATGVGLLLFAQAAAASTALTIDDRVAVAAGAEATAEVKDSWLLDRQAPLSADDPEKPGYGDPAPGVRNPPLGAGRTVLWRTHIGDPTQFGSADLLVVDPRTFLAAALWGSGQDLAEARRLLERLADADARTAAAIEAGSRAVIPVIAVGYPAVRVGDQVDIVPAVSTVSVEAIGAAAAFPGFGNLPMLVAPATSLFRAIPLEDPRPHPRPASSPSTFSAEMWDGLGADDAARTLLAFAVPDAKVSTAGAVRSTPRFEAARQALAYQQALGWCAALVALVAFGLYAERTASLAGAADLLLARVGLGGGGVRRARVLEPAVMVAVAGALALLAVLLLRPMAGRLLDPQRGAVPAFVLEVDVPVLAVGLAFLAVAALTAAVVALARQRSQSPDRVLRDG